MKGFGTPFLITAIYDFASDGGAVGTISLGEYLGTFSQPRTVVTGFFMKGITTITSGGALTLSAGYTGAVTAFMGATAVGALPAGGASARGVDLDATPVTLDAPIQIVCAIAGAAATAGKCYFLVRGFIVDL